MTVTLKDVAKKAGVSIPTVSLIINGRDLPFKESTRRAVLEAVEALNYRPDSMARRNANGSNRRDAVALLLRSESRSRVANSPVYEFICGVNDVLMEQNQFLVMMKLHQLEQQDQTGAPPRVIAERFVDGLIVETGLPPQLELAVDRYRIPTVWLNTNHHNPSDCVYPDEIHAGRTVTEHLIKLGHRNIAFVASIGFRRPDAPFSVVDRQLGYEQAMTMHRLPIRAMHEEGIVDPTSIINSTFSDLSEVVTAIAQSRKTKEPITGVVTYDFSQAMKLRFELQAIGIICPRDISIVVAEDLRFLRRSWRDFTGITCDRYGMGRQAAEMMLAKITAGGQPQPSHIHRGTLIDGFTSAPPPSTPSPTGKPARNKRAK